MYKQIDLATYTKRWEIDARLHRTAGGGQQYTVVLRLEIIEIRAVAVHDSANTMAGTMHKVIPVTGAGDDCAGNIIYLATLDALICCQLFAHKGDACVTRPLHDLEYFTLVRGDLVACASKSHPGIIGEDRIGFRQVRPEVEQDQVSALNGAVIVPGWLIERVAGIRVDCYMWRIVQDQSGMLYDGCEPLHDAVFIERCTHTQVIA